MKYLLLILLLVGSTAFGQTTYYIRADSTKLEKVGGNNELILKNSTRPRTGAYLKNISNGITGFFYAVDSAWMATDSTLVVRRGDGNDTLLIRGSGISTTPGIDDVLAVNQAVQPGRTVNTNGNLPFFTNGATKFDSIQISNSVAGEDFMIRNRNIALGFPVATIKAVTNNKNIALDIMPMGTPGDFSTNGIAWIDVCDVNAAPGTGNVGTARVGITTTAVQFGSRAFGVSAKPVQFVVDTDTRMTLSTTNTATFNIGKITQSQSLSGDYVGYTLLNTNNSVTESNPIFFIGNDFAALRFGYIRWNNGAAYTAPRYPNQLEICSNTATGLNGGMLLGALGASGKIRLGTGTAGVGIVEAMIIDSTNMIGIGTSTPSATLDLVGTLQYVDGNQSNGFVLTSDASGNATWQAASGGGGGTPAGNFGNLQINRNGAFATPGSDSLDFESATGLTVKGNITSSTLTNGRVLVGGTSGLIRDYAALTYDGTNLLSTTTGGAGTGITITSTNASSYSSLNFITDVGGNGFQIGKYGSTGTVPNGVFFYNPDNSPTVFTQNNNRILDITGPGNLLLGGTSDPASAYFTIGLFNGGAPTGSITNGVILYSEDVAASAELKVRDEAGNITVLSPHNFTGIPMGESEPQAWSYYSEKDGKYITVDMLKAMRTIEDLTRRVEKLEKELNMKSKKPVKLVYTGTVKKK